MKTSLCFGIKLEKRALLHKLKSYPYTSQEHPTIKITPKKLTIIKRKTMVKQNSKNKNETSKNS